MASGAVIPEQRTAVPVEWDELRQQLEQLTHLLVPDQPGGLSTLGSVVHTTAATLRGQGREHPGHHHQTVTGDRGTR